MIVLLVLHFPITLQYKNMLLYFFYYYNFLPSLTVVRPLLYVEREILFKKLVSLLLKMVSFPGSGFLQG